MPVESLVTSTLTDLPRLAKEGADIDTLLAVARQAAAGAAKAVVPKPSDNSELMAGSPLKSAAAIWPGAAAGGKVPGGSPPKSAAAMQCAVGGDVGIAWHEGLGAKPIDDFFHG